MAPTSGFPSREDVFDHLDSYAFQRREEVDRRKLALGLIKSYVVETSPADQSTLDIPALLHDTGWRSVPVADDGIHVVYDHEGEWGFIDPISPRYLMFHTYRRTDQADAAIKKWVRDKAQLDSLWLAGDYFSVLWENVILPQMPDRFVSFKFEHLAQFEDNQDQFEDTEGTELEDWNAEEVIERRASTSSITEQARRVKEFLPSLQASHRAFKAIKMLRLPAAETRGGQDFWSWGKVTHRTPNFREGREQILSVTQLYAQATRVIEKLLWFQVERVGLKDNQGAVIRGAPLTLEFSEPLSLETFHNLIDVTFERAQGPLRLWGNPIWLGERKVHVYGIDLHLWQRIYVELTPRRMLVILPKGTCGNTVHRLMTNIQRNVDPGVKMSVGNVDYSRLIRDTLLGKIDDSDLDYTDTTFSD